ncbi:MAG: ABC transporter ATP-binding protein [Deltaproteobacteria bacterium]|nr:ABC transporter ATP-binding protein [Deltaproteobacteria bacterium]
MAGPLIELKDISKSFGKGSARVDVLNNIDLSLEAGEMVAVLGASGAGKSTMLHILGGIDRPTSGKVLYKGDDIYRMGNGKLSLFRNRDLGFVFQSHHLLPEFTALENVMMPSMIAGHGRNEAREKSLSILDKVGLSHRWHHKSGELSGGEQQRVAVARSLVMNPAVVLADEPTGNLDSKTGDEVFGLMMELNRNMGITLVMVTHNEKLAARLGRKIVVKDGRIAS